MPISCLPDHGPVLVTIFKLLSINLNLHLLYLIRNKDSHNRPQFRDIHQILSQNDEHVLKIPDKDLQTHSQAGVLGAPLEAGENMYIDIQKTYVYAT